MIVFEWLKSWFESNADTLEKRTIKYTFSELNKNIDKPSQSVEIETTEKIAQIILWETGECDVLIIDLETQEDTWFEYQIVNSQEELNNRIERLFAMI